MPKDMPKRYTKNVYMPKILKAMAKTQYGSTVDEISGAPSNFLLFYPNRPLSIFTFFGQANEILL